MGEQTRQRLVRVSRSQVAAAQLQVALNRDLGRATSAKVLAIANAKPLAEWDQENDTGGRRPAAWATQRAAPPQ